MARIVFIFAMMLSVMSVSAAGAASSNGMWERGFEPLSPAERREALGRIALFEKLGIDTRQVRIDRQRMPWRSDAHVYRASGAWEPNNLFFYFVRQPDGRFVQLDGTSPPIHAFNKAYPPRLNDETVGPYLWFFSFFVRGEEGPFLVAESPRDTFVPKSDFKGAEIAEGETSVAGLFRPARCSAGAEKGTHECNARVYYSNAVFGVDFRVQPGGMVEMVGDRPLAVDLPVKIAAPISETSVGRAFKPKTPASRDAVAPLEGRIDAGLIATLRALDAGREFRLTQDNMPFVAGLASQMMEQCGLPKSAATRARLSAYVATSTIGAMVGFDYSNPNLGTAIGSMARQQALLASGALAVRTIGCTPDLDRIGENLARAINANTAKGSGFVASCTPSHSARKCTCLADIGRQVMPDIAERRYSPRLVKEVIQRNPFIGLTIGLTCGISNY